MLMSPGLLAQKINSSLQIISHQSSSMLMRKKDGTSFHIIEDGIICT